MPKCVFLVVSFPCLYIYLSAAAYMHLLIHWCLAISLLPLAITVTSSTPLLTLHDNKHIHAAAHPDATRHPHTLLLQHSLSTPSLNGMDAFLSLISVPITSTITAMQIMKVRERMPDLQLHTSRITLVNNFLSSLLAGSWMSTGEVNAVKTGIWNHTDRRWEEHVVCIIHTFAGSPPSVGKSGKVAFLELMLGDVNYAGYGGCKDGVILSYILERFGFARGMFPAFSTLIIHPQTYYLLQTQF